MDIKELIDFMRDGSEDFELEFVKPKPVTRKQAKELDELDEIMNDLNCQDFLKMTEFNKPEFDANLKSWTLEATWPVVNLDSSKKNKTE